MEEGSWSSCFKHRYVRMRSVPVRGNTSACLWRLKWTWPVYHSQERELAVAGATLLASLSSSCPHSVWATLPDRSFSATVDTTGAHAAFWIKVQSVILPMLRGPFLASCAYSVPIPFSATVQPSFPGSAMYIPVSVN